jgi:hypothetical protein
MSHITCHMSISLDGFVAGPDQSQDNPLGVGGLKLHQWHFHAGEPDLEPIEVINSPHATHVRYRITR